MVTVITQPTNTPLTAQFHGSVLRPDLTQNSAKRVLKSNTPRKQFCLQCTFPRLVFARRFARARGRIIMKFPTRAPRLKLLSRSFGSKQKYFSVRRNIFEFHFRSQKCEQKCEHIWLQNWAVELQGNSICCLISYNFMESQNTSYSPGHEFIIILSHAHKFKVTQTSFKSRDVATC